MITTLLGYKTTENKTAIIAYDTHELTYYLSLNEKTIIVDDPDHDPLCRLAGFIDENPIDEITHISEITQLFDDDLDFDVDDVRGFNPNENFMKSMEKINDAFEEKGFINGTNWKCSAEFVIACVEVFIPLGC